MARLHKRALIARAVEAISNGNWTIKLLTTGDTHPARFTMTQDGVSHTVRLYIWNLSHGGKSRSESEFRIQVTGIEEFALEPKGRTLILGWSEDFGMFAGFDIHHRLGKISASPSVQVTSVTLQSGNAAGASVQDKTKGEWVVAVRPDKLSRYVQHLATAHRGNLDPLLASDESEASDPLASELARLADDSTGFDLSVAGEADLRKALVADVDEVIAALDAGKERAPAQIGHNQPPEPLEEQAPLTPKIKAEATRLKDNLLSYKPDGREIGRSGAFLAWAGRVLQAAKQKGARAFGKGKDMSREYMARALWGVSGTLGIAFKEELVEMIRNLARGILNWLQHTAFF